MPAYAQAAPTGQAAAPWRSALPAACRARSAAAPAQPEPPPVVPMPPRMRQAHCPLSAVLPEQLPALSASGSGAASARAPETARPWLCSCRPAPAPRVLSPCRSWHHTGHGAPSRHPTNQKPAIRKEKTRTRSDTPPVSCPPAGCPAAHCPAARRPDAAARECLRAHRVAVPAAGCRACVFPAAGCRRGRLPAAGDTEHPSQTRRAYPGKSPDRWICPPRCHRETPSRRPAVRSRSGQRKFRTRLCRRSV